MTTLADLERDLGPRLRSAYRAQLPIWEHDDNIRLHDAGPESANDGPLRSRIALGVAAGMIGLLGAGLIWIDGQVADDRSAAEPADPVELDATDVVTVDFVEDQMWYIPTQLPAMFDSSSASYSTMRFQQILTYHDASGDRSITIAWGSGRPPRVATEPRGELGIENATWKVFDGRTDESELHTFETERANAWLAVNTIGISYEDALNAVRSLSLQPATDLELPPLPTDSGDGAIVATASIDGTNWTLRAHTDGQSFVFETFGLGHMTSSPQTILDDVPAQLLQLFDPDVEDAPAVLIGATRDDVASVVIEFTDGSSITVEPSPADGFDERFFIAATPSIETGGNETLLDEIVAVSAYDTEQQLLGRTDRLFGE